MKKKKNLMTKKTKYRKKVFILLLIILGLSLVYAAIIFFDSQHRTDRASTFSLLDQRLLSYADRIEINGLYGTIILIKRNNAWVLIDKGNEYPVKQNPVDDLLAALCRRGVYPIRSNTAAESARYGVDGSVSRIIVRGGAGRPLLDLYIGYTDLTGGEIFLRKAGQNEIRSGVDRFTYYTENSKNFWYDLRLFPLIEPAMVQRIRLSSVLDEEDRPLLISRSRNNWILENSNVQFSGGDYYLRSLLDTRAEDFAEHSGWILSENIFLELGDGSFRVLFIGPETIDGSRQAMVSDSSLVFSLSEWAVRRLYPDL